MSNLKELYNKEITASLMKEYNYSSKMEVPKLEKIVIASQVIWLKELSFTFPAAVI